MFLGSSFRLSEDGFGERGHYNGFGLKSGVLERSITNQLQDFIDGLVHRGGVAMQGTRCFGRNLAKLKPIVNLNASKTY
jgi:hypothetical protein